MFYDNKNEQIMVGEEPFLVFFGNADIDKCNEQGKSLPDCVINQQISRVPFDFSTQYWLAGPDKCTTGASSKDCSSAVGLVVNEDTIAHINFISRLESDMMIKATRAERFKESVSFEKSDGEKITYPPEELNPIIEQCSRINDINLRRQCISGRLKNLNK